MPATQTTAEKNKFINELVDEFRPAVSKIENSIPTTRDHYGRYMALLSTFDKAQRKTIAVLLIKAGANLAGVQWAIRLLG